MAFPLPRTLTPSKASSFRSCALAFRLSAIDHLPEPPSEPAVRGSVVHRALELLMCLPAAERNPAAGHECLRRAMGEYADNAEFVGLELDDDGHAAFQRATSAMVERYFQLEDPRTLSPVGLELDMRTDVGGLPLRGIIDRLDIEDGALIVTDYKTGRVPGVRDEQSRLSGVHFYALMCERILGSRPAEVRLMYLGPSPQTIVARPTEQSTRALERRLGAMWGAISTACEREDFRPQPGPLCSWCAFQAYCPAFGGTPPSSAG